MSAEITKKNSTMADERPRVWVACLASYNSGILHGEWITVPDTVEEMQEEIDRILETSSEPFADEWAFHDSQYFGPFDFTEYEGLEMLVKKANIINQTDDIRALTAWDSSSIDFEKMDAEEIIEKFQDEFLGVYDSEEDFSCGHIQDCHEIPDYLESYIDYSKFWRDLTYDGYYSAYAPSMKFYIFRNS